MPRRTSSLHTASSHVLAAQMRARMQASVSARACSSRCRKGDDSELALPRPNPRYDPRGHLVGLQGALGSAAASQPSKARLVLAHADDTQADAPDPATGEDEPSARRDLLFRYCDVSLVEAYEEASEAAREALLTALTEFCGTAFHEIAGVGLDAEQTETVMSDIMRGWGLPITLEAAPVVLAQHAAFLAADQHLEREVSVDTRAGTSEAAADAGAHDEPAGVDWSALQQAPFEKLPLFQELQGYAVVGQVATKVYHNTQDTEDADDQARLGCFVTYLRDGEGRLMQVLFGHEGAESPLESRQTRDLKSLLTRGNVVAISHPYLMITPETGARAIRITSPAKVKVVRSAQDSIGDAVSLCQYLLCMRQHQDALDVYHETVQQHPSNHSAVTRCCRLLLSRARALCGAGDAAGGLADAAAALVLQPGDSEAWYAYRGALSALSCPGLVEQARAVASALLSATSESGPQKVTQEEVQRALNAASASVCELQDLPKECSEASSLDLRDMINGLLRSGSEECCRQAAQLCTFELTRAGDAATLAPLHCALADAHDANSSFHSVLACASAARRLEPRGLDAFVRTKAARALMCLGERELPLSLLQPQPSQAGSEGAPAVTADAMRAALERLPPPYGMAVELESPNARLGRVRLPSTTASAQDASPDARAGASEAEINDDMVNEAAVYNLADWYGPVEMMRVPGKGRGLRATRDIAVGEIVLANRALACAVEAETYNDTLERVLITKLCKLAEVDVEVATVLSMLDDRSPHAPRDAQSEADLPDMPLEHVMRRAFGSSTLPLLPQAPQYAPPVERRSVDQSTVERIVRVNCFGANLGAAERSIGSMVQLSPLVALLNHDSKPNCLAGCSAVGQGMQSVDVLVTVVSAREAISAGDELTICYSSDPAHLRATWGIEQV